MALPTSLLLTLPLTLAVFVGAWIVSLIRHDTSVVDVLWGLAFVVIAGFVYDPAMPSPRGTLVLVMTGIWGLRLTSHLALRNHAMGEDPRYAAWRREHGHRWPLRSLATVFVLQGVLCWIVSWPVQWAIVAPTARAFAPTDLAGFGLWAVGLAWEAVADAQLRRFKRDPANRGRILTKGLWKRSRHPNYFGEILVWWGFFLVALAAPQGWLTLVSPLLVTGLLMFVSGVPMTERRMAERPGWQEYAAGTPALWPRLVSQRRR